MNKALALLPLLLHSPATAQERFTALVGLPGGSPVVLDVELDAGGVSDLVEIELAAVTPVPLPQDLTIARIAGQLWLGTIDGIFRYDETPGPARYAYVDQVQPGSRYLTIDPAPGGAVAMVLDFNGGFFVDELDANGTLIQRQPVDDVYRSFVPNGAGYVAVSDDFGVVQLDASFQVTGRFAQDAASLAASAGLGYFPHTLTLLSDGRIAIVAPGSIAITDSAGNVLGIANPGVFEWGALETGGGLLLVPCEDGIRLLDPNTLEAFEVGGAFDTDIGFRFSNASSSALTAASTRGCATSPNSVGSGARIHLLGMVDSAERTLTAIGTGMPGNALTLPVFGTAEFNAPYGDGRLCVSPFQQGITRGVVLQSSALGSAQVDFDFTGPQSGAGFLPGTTWHFQLIYRDGFGPAGFNGTDGVSITFRP
ncbi:MAG: hypothetical protein AAF726_13745 [Planctomycetota bacterium]